MKAFSVGLIAEQGLTVTRPGYFVWFKLGGSDYRYATFDDTSWDGYTWTGMDIKVGSLRTDDSGRQSGELSLGNTDMEFSALLLNNNVADAPVRIWAVWAGVIEPVEVFSGVADAVEIGLRARITLTSAGTKVLFSPRRFINSASGFMTLLPKGTKIKIGQQTYTLER